MANKNKFNNKRKKARKKYTEVERAAFIMGQVERGLKNPDSRITASFQKGNSEPKVRSRKPLF